MAVADGRRWRSGGGGGGGSGGRSIRLLLAEATEDLLYYSSVTDGPTWFVHHDFTALETLD